MDLCSDIIFLVDILLNFFYVQEDDNGNFIILVQQLARNYLKSWFVIDLISSVPVSIIMLFTNFSTEANNQILSIKFLKLLRLFTLYRILSIVKIFRLFKNSKILELVISKVSVSDELKIAFVSFGRITFMVHIMGCIWIIIG